MKINGLKKGDIVGRKSYGKDIAFFISDIYIDKNVAMAMLKGITIRIVADSPIFDLEVLSDKAIKNAISKFDFEISNVKEIKNTQKVQILKRNSVKYGRILHLDGDRRYSEKSQRFYKNMGLNVIVKNITENKQPQVINSLLNKYYPDVLIVTGHDGMIKKGHNFNDIYNYRNSRYFVETVIRARMWERGKNNNLAIFAGACQSYYEALIEAGANFASSPARIMIEYRDPLIIASKIAYTDSNKYVSINDLKPYLKSNYNGMGGTRAKGKKNGWQKDKKRKCNSIVI